MATFLVLAQKNINTHKLPEAIEAKYPSQFIKVSDEAWIISVKKISIKELSDNLGISDGSNGAAIIVEFTNYFGRAASNIWAWVKEQVEAT